MASTKIPLYKQNSLIDILIKPYEDKEKEKRDLLRKYITDIYKENIPQDVKEMFSKYSDFIETTHYIKFYFSNKQGYTDYDNIHFYNENDPAACLYLPKLLCDNVTELFKSTGTYDKAYEMLMDYYKEYNTKCVMKKKLKNALEKNNTPTKLKDNMPTIYKVYMEQIEHITKEVDNGCDAAELVNAHLSKFFNN